jgi:Rod binding domain-containing protein
MAAAPVDGIQAAAARLGAARTPSLREAARDFEALLLQQFLRQAAKPLGKHGALDRDPGARLAREMLFDELALQAGRSGSLRLGDLLGAGGEGAEK